MRIRSQPAEPDQRSTPLPAVTEELVRLHASAESFRRGEEHLRQGAVASVVRRGDELHAEVQGSEPLPYAVRVMFDATGVADAHCSCPYDWGGWCKHIVAVLLAGVHAPDEIAERPPLAALLAGLDADQLRALVLRLAAQNPILTDAVERALDTLIVAAPTGSAAAQLTPAPVDERRVRQEVRQAFRGLGRMSGSEAYYRERTVLGDQHHPRPGRRDHGSGQGRVLRSRRRLAAARSPSLRSGRPPGGVARADRGAHRPPRPQVQATPDARRNAVGPAPGSAPRPIPNSCATSYRPRKSSHNISHA